MTASHINLTFPNYTRPLWAKKRRNLALCLISTLENLVRKSLTRLTLVRDRGARQQILTFSEASDGESNHVNHTETELSCRDSIR